MLNRPNRIQIHCRKWNFVSLYSLGVSNTLSFLGVLILHNYAISDNTTLTFLFHAQRATAAGGPTLLLAARVPPHTAREELEQSSSEFQVLADE